MRGLVLFVAGILVGTAAQTTLAQNDAFVLNHVGLAVPDLTQAAAFYTEKLGYREAFRNSNPQGAPTAIYMQISRSTFLEHYGLHVDNMKSAVDRFRARGVTVSDPTGPSAFSGAVLAQLTVPDGPRIELAELGPNSLQRKAMDGWK
jgi:catechol 2,3-dioxygenase-like lactoylglutathione lyase family enzyme